MRAYAAIFSARLRLLLQYRAAAFAGLVTQVFWGAVRVMIFQGFYAAQALPQPLTLPQVVTYVWLGQAFFRLLPWVPDPDVRQLVKTGSVAYEMVRPVDLYGLWYSRAVANALAPTLLRAGPLLILALGVLGMAPPVSALATLGWVLALAGSTLLSCALSTLMSISLLWTVAGEGTIQFIPAVMCVLSGMIIPLPFFPEWLGVWIRRLPFCGLVDLPSRIYMGNIPHGAIPGILAEQLLWTAALVLMGRALLARGVRRLEVHGG